MIKANELRIGNCVKLNNSDTTLVPRDFQRYCKSFGIFEEFEPIKLSEEWLLKAVAEKIADYSFYINNIHIGIYHSKSGNGLVYKISINNVSIAELKYVHELQNLYFCLTGEELVFSSTEP